MHNSYYFDAKHINLNKLQQEAEERLAARAYGEPESTVLHHHRHGELCIGKEHEFFLTEVDKKKHLQ